MSILNYYNKEKLIKVSVHLTVISNSYYYHPGFKFLGITLDKEGVYDCLFDKFQGATPPGHQALIGTIVYRKPYVVLHYEDGHRLTTEFENDSEARQFSHRVTKGGLFTDGKY